MVPTETPQSSFWHRLERVLARVRPHRRTVSLVIDGCVVAIAWQATYLFRLGMTPGSCSALSPCIWWH